MIPISPRLLCCASMIEGDYVCDIGTDHAYLPAYLISGGTAKTTVRTLRSAELDIRGNEWILTVSGDAFLYNMVRIIAGTVAEIGLGRLGTDAFSKAFETGDRLALGMTAPAHGLELTKVFYPEKAFTNPASLRWHEEETTCSD